VDVDVDVDVDVELVVCDDITIVVEEMEDMEEVNAIVETLLLTLLLMAVVKGNVEDELKVNKPGRMLNGGLLTILPRSSCISRRYVEPEGPVHSKAPALGILTEQYKLESQRVEEKLYLQVQISESSYLPCFEVN
jgi:hypothetical protein